MRPTPFGRAHVVSVLRAEVARVFGLDLPASLLLLLSSFERRHLGLCQDEVLLR